MATLFTTTPAASFNDGGSSGITTSTTVTFDTGGQVTGIRFYGPPGLSGQTVTVELWQCVSLDDGAPNGTLLASKSIAGSSATVGAYNLVTLNAPVTVDSTHVYRTAVNITSGLYSATSGIFPGGPLVNGHITGIQNRTAPYAGLYNGAFALNTGPGVYPSIGSGSGSAYFVDPDFTPAGSAITLAANLTATSGLTAALTSPTTTVAATLGATAGLSATFVVPTGPADLIASPAAKELLTCFKAKLAELPNPPKHVQLRVGSETGPLMGPGVDECCDGLAWVRVANVYPSWDSFPAADNTWSPCGPLAYAVVLEMGMAFCMPWSDSDDTLDSVDPPSALDWETAFNTQMQHQNLMRQTAACCFRPTQRRAVGEWVGLSVEGGCTGGKLTLTVSVMNPCSDC